MNLSLMLAGAYLIIDGIGSIARYFEQGFWDQLVRVIRAGIGLSLLIAGCN